MTLARARGGGPVEIALVGDYDAGVTAHRAIPLALERAGTEAGVDVRFTWHHGAARVAAGALPCDIGRHLVRAGQPLCQHLGGAFGHPVRAPPAESVPRHLWRISARASRICANRSGNRGRGARRTGRHGARSADRAAIVRARGASGRGLAGSRIAAGDSVRRDHGGRGVPLPLRAGTPPRRDSSGWFAGGGAGQGGAGSCRGAGRPPVLRRDALSARARRAGGDHASPGSCIRSGGGRSRCRCESGREGR